jgi:hypothetical protein
MNIQATIKKAMAAQFTPITAEEMEKFILRGFRALKPKRATNGSELVYLLTIEGNIGIKVETSISVSGTEVREVGSDAIRVIYFHLGRMKPLIAGKAPIVKRTQGWKTNLQDRIEEVIEEHEARTGAREKEIAMLKALIASRRLSPAEASAFPKMLASLESGEFYNLTDRQWDWVSGKHQALGL